MLSSTELKKITAEARPIIERQLADAEKLAGLREVVAAHGGDWGQLKALIKAQIKDEDDEAGEGKHVAKILSKADYATAYADMLGLDRRNLNEKNSFAEAGSQLDPKLAERIAQAVQTDIGRAALLAAIDIMIDHEERVDPETGEIADPPDHISDLTKMVAATQSTAALTEVRDNSTGEVAAPLLADPVAATTLPAGTQAPPVDTNSQAKASTGNADSLAVRDGRETNPKVAGHVGSGEASRLSVGSGTDATIPTPAGGGNTTEPDSGLALQFGSEVAAHLPGTANDIGSGGVAVAGTGPLPTAKAGNCVADDDRTAASTVFSADVDQRIDRQPPKLEAAGSSPAVSANHEATGKSEAEQSASAPAPGVVYMERCPPVGVERHEFQRCFPDLFGLRLLSFIKDVETNGVQKPIVKMGDMILDGWTRYTAARELGIDYPVVQYAGSDPLADMIRWNLTSGRLMTMAERKTIATKLAKLPGNEHRASEIYELFGLEERVAA